MIRLAGVFLMLFVVNARAQVPAANQPAAASAPTPAQVESAESSDPKTTLGNKTELNNVTKSIDDEFSASPQEKEATSKIVDTTVNDQGEIRVKSPFMIPSELYRKLRQVKPTTKAVDTIDATSSPRVRWPLREYRVMMVLSNVKKPRALIADLEKTTHLFHVKDKIGNADGYISEITKDGEVIVVEKAAEVVLLKQNPR